MSLHEALRKSVRLFGISVLGEERLMPILSDFRAFDEFPAMRQVMGSAIADGRLKELCDTGRNLLITRPIAFSSRWGSGLP